MIVTNIARVTNETVFLAHLGQPEKLMLLSTSSIKAMHLSKLMRSKYFTRNGPEKLAKTVRKWELNRSTVLHV